MVDSELEDLPNNWHDSRGITKPKPRLEESIVADVIWGVSDVNTECLKQSGLVSVITMGLTNSSMLKGRANRDRSQHQ